MVSPEEYGNELVLLLSQSTSNDNNLIKQATSKLQTHLKNDLAIITLLSIAANNPENHLRQLAAIECSKRISKQWLNVLQNDKNLIKQNVLDLILREQHTLTRLSLSRVISQIAKIEIPLSQWQNLVPWLFECCNSGVSVHREVGISVLFDLFDTLIDLQDQYQNMFGNLLNLFSITINDADSFLVRIFTLRSLGKVADCLDSDDVELIKTFQTFIPKMVGVLEQALANDDEDMASKGFEVFYDMLYLESPVLSRHIGDLVHFAISVASKKDLSPNLRVMALNFLIFSVDIKRSKIQKLKLVPNMLQAMFVIGAEDEDEDDTDDCPSKSAFQVISAIAVNLPPTQVFPTVMEFIVNYIQNPEFGVRKSCLLALAVIVDGCADFMRAKIDGILPVIQAGLQDQHPIVRKSACMALGSLAEELEEEICMNHAHILPLLFQILNNDSSVTALSHATNALDAIIEGMESSELVGYLPALMEKLLLLLNSSTSQELKATVIGAIGSAAHASKKEFVPYFNAVINALSPFMSKVTEDEIILRGVATDTLAAVAEAVGKDLFRPYVPDLMNLVNQGLHFKDSRLIECSFCFFAVMARVFTTEFVPYLEHVVPALLASCKQEEKNHFEFEDYDEDLGNEDEDSKYNANNAIAEEKEVAADALAQIFSSTTTHFLAYVEPSIDILIQLLDHYFEGVRKSAASAMFLFLHTFYKISSPAEWEQGLPVKVSVHSNVESMVKLVVGAVLSSFDEEFDKYTAINILQNFSEALKLVGPCLLVDPNHKEALFKNILVLLKGEHTCQKGFDDEENPHSNASSLDVDVDQSEQDALVISAAADVICAISLVLGEQFLNDYKHFHPYVVKYFKPTRSASERSMAIGTIAEVAEGLKFSITNYVQEFLSLLSAALRDEAEEVRSNGAYGIGILYQYANIEQHCMSILHSIQPLITTHKKNSTINLKDNALGAVSRIIIKNPSVLPLDQILPILMENLPLEKDYLEYKVVMECLILCVTKGLAEVNLSWLFRLISTSFENFDLKTKKLVKEFLKIIATDNQTLQGLLSSLGEEHSKIINNIIHS
ncbi:hypothetical protein HK099_006680 [Clydaea vesicula]|uniref:Importin N-terminal domain-containing protein n=1 Tax=Clydaea vesicula TaxID=447962 RepID=A0AAD5XYX8_9FUNG|nr:hypothetical protein HK099_006680 [Clydaea vesicula]KAJ3397432.1 hypothetical protein HDU92_007821 [Lobulomyces angularis]